jgi:heme ABC exporter ATP-binding subunit CcmA
MDTVVEYRRTVVLVGRFPALTGVDLTVSTGEIVLLQGPNGAGKTTLLRTSAGLLPVASGSASVLGVDLARDRRAVRRWVGLLAHTTHLYDDLTVSDNALFWARSTGASTGEAVAALDRLDVPRRLRDVSVQRLSAGQRRRVAIACVVARRPRLWLLDEPHAGLDQEGRDLVDGLLREASAAGATVLFASHELDRALSVATRVVTLAAGAVVEAEGAAPRQPAVAPGGQGAR